MNSVTSLVGRDSVKRSCDPLSLVRERVRVRVPAALREHPLTSVLSPSASAPRGDEEVSEP